MSDTLRVSNLYLGTNATTYNQPQIGFTSVGIGSTSNYGFLQFFGTPNTFCWTANGTVGIGLTNPSYPLTLKTATSSYGLTHTDGTIIVGSFVGGSATAGWYGTTSNHPLCFFTNNSAPQMTVATSGNVGIGLTNPTALLHLQGTPSNGDTSRQLMLYGQRFGTPSVQNSTSFSLSLGPNVSTVNPYGSLDIRLNGFPNSGNSYGIIPDVIVMSIIGNGYVGIGTTNPTYPLHVAGGSTVNLGGALFTNWATLSFSYAQYGSGATLSGPSGGVYTVTTSGASSGTVELISGGFTNGLSYQISVQVSGGTAQSFTFNDSYGTTYQTGTLTGSYVTYTFLINTSVSSQLWISIFGTASGQTLFFKNLAVQQLSVGIGTMNPAAPLHVNGNIIANVFYSSTGTISGAYSGGSYYFIPLPTINGSSPIGRILFFSCNNTSSSIQGSISGHIYWGTYTSGCTILSNFGNSGFGAQFYYNGSYGYLQLTVNNTSGVTYYFTAVS